MTSKWTVSAVHKELCAYGRAPPHRTWRRLAAAVQPNVVLTYIDILLRLRSSVTPDKLLGTLLYYYISSDQSTLRSQFYIRLMYICTNHILEHEFFCLGYLGSKEKNQYEYVGHFSWAFFKILKRPHKTAAYYLFYDFILF